MSARSKIESGFEFFARGVLRWPAIVILVAVTIGLRSLVPQVRTDDSQESFLEKSDPARAGYDRFKEQFGADERIHILFRPESPL